MVYHRAWVQPVDHFQTKSLGLVRLQPSPSHHDVAKGADRTTQAHRAAFRRPHVTTHTAAERVFRPSATDLVFRPPLTSDRHPAQNASASQLSRRLCRIGQAPFRSAAFLHGPFCKPDGATPDQFCGHAPAELCSSRKSRSDKMSANAFDLNGGNLAAQTGGF